MAKHIVVKKKRTLKFSGIVGSIMTLALVLSFISQVFVKTNNIQLARDIQNIETEIYAVQESNTNLAAEITKLRDTNYVASIAEAAGLELNNNVVKIIGD